MIGSFRSLQSITVTLPILFGNVAAAGTSSAPLAQTFNPISQVARIFNPRLENTEKQVRELESRLSSLAAFRDRPLKSGIGYRGGRLNPADPDPTLIIDLGGEYPLSSIFLIPAQRESPTEPSLFPKQFTIELSNREDFGQRIVTYTAGNTPYPSSDTRPARFVAHNTFARYVRLTVHKGESMAAGEMFALSEMIVISNGDPVSFGAKVLVQNSLDVPGQWAPEYLTDGSMPLGIWQGGEWKRSSQGEVVTASSPSDRISWTLDLGTNAPISRVHLFPQAMPGQADCTILPAQLTVTLESSEGTSETVEWKNPLPGSHSTTPLVLPFHQKLASRIRIESVAPWSMGKLNLHALSEIEVWSSGKNIASGKAIQRTQGNVVTPVLALTDGFASERRILPLATWLDQLNERWRVEADLAWYTPLLREMISESELNATWGAAVMLGLTFLIPVFIVERRRLINRTHLENLRKRIASDLHDDIGSNLGSISLIARTARKDLIKQHGPEEVAEDLGQVESIARESSLAMRDIVWLLERRADTIGDLIQRMRDTANRLLRDVEYTLECDSCKIASKLSLDAKRHLFLFYKETIHNVFKHSKATRVSVRLWDKDDKLVLEICDNGIGFDANSPTKPTSVHKLEERGRVLEGKVDILSIPTKGTSVRLTVKRSHLIAHTSLP
jgi:signal transduction histidine kinase